jgi:hypothetical protein
MIGTFQQVAVLVIILLSSLGSYGANAADNRSPDRAVWYDLGGIGSEKDIDAEVTKYNRLHINRVHIVVNHKYNEIERCECQIKPTAIPNECSRRYTLIEPEQKNACLAKVHHFAFDKWLDDDLGRFVDKLGAAKIAVYLTVWPVPNSSFIVAKKGSKSNLYNLIDFVRRHNKFVTGIELEDEDNWKDAYLDEQDNRVSGGKKADLILTREEAARRLVNILRHNLPGVKIGVTMAPGDFDERKLIGDSLIDGADFISFQAHQPVYTNSVYANTAHLRYEKPFLEQPCTDVMHLISGERYSPGIFQRRAISTIVRAGLADKPTIMALAAYQRNVRIENSQCLGFAECKGRKDGKECLKQVNAAGFVTMFKEAQALACNIDKDSLQPQGGNVSGLKSFLGTAYWSVSSIKNDRDKRHQDYAYKFLSSCDLSAIRSMCGSSQNPSMDEIVKICSQKPTVKPRRVDKRQATR